MTTNSDIPDWVYGVIVCVGIPAAMVLFAWVMP
jgi:hypothetical protein